MSIEELGLIVSRVATFLILLPLAVSFWQRRQLNSALKSVYLYFIILLVISIILQIILWAVDNYTDFFVPILTKLDIQDMSFISILEVINQLILLSWFYAHVFRNTTLSKTIQYTSGALIISCLINYFFIEGYNVPSIFNGSILSIYFTILPLIHFRFIFTNPSTQIMLRKNPYFWINLAILLRHIMGLFLQLAGKKMFTTDVPLFLVVNVADDFLQVISLILFAIGFYYARYTKYLPEKW
jgi:hypothetical protein